ncbi:type II toxin-antitoxin system SpoIISA family toxin [Lentibacillus juripiscarius]|uniref:Type II toxin-antitoxin system SpoIISA family toxin n=1 Tax=Lentibacillus juripiscarius TaxID=257446 RepID=A0ABW5V7T2_9BACI
MVGGLAFFQLIDKGDWQYLLMGAAVIIFVDIAVFSIPTIRKIWKTEFGSHDDIKEYIQKNDLMAENQQDKLNYFSELVQLAP